MRSWREDLSARDGFDDIGFTAAFTFRSPGHAARKQAWNTSSKDKDLPGRIAAALAKDKAMASQIFSCTAHPVSIARSTISFTKFTGSRFSIPAGRPLIA